MSDWTAGYVADIGYTYGYYPELNPLRVKLAFLNQGLAFPEFGSACELGFGQGLSANMHAAASLITWHGNDFNPAQAGFAQELGAVAGTGAQLSDESFAEFAARIDLPQFDYIGLHGIWSWISDDNRTVIVEFIRRRLKVGGVLYISYNTLPGWAAFAPMRHLLTLHSQVQGSDGQGIVGRIDSAFDFADKLLATNPGYARANPSIPDRIKKVKEQNRHYVAHEYFNRDWMPMHFATMAEWLEPAKLQFACSATHLEHVDPLNLTPDQQSLLKTIGDVTLRETTRDFMINQQFRRDYWVRGARKLSALEQRDALRALRVLLIVPRTEVSLKVTGAVGEANMSEAVYDPILELLSDHKPHTLGQIEQAVRDKGVSFAQVLQSTLVLSGAGHIAGVQDDALAAKARKQTDKLNAYLMHKARGSQDVAYLASPVTGGGVPVPRFSQLFLAAYMQGKKQPVDWVQPVWQVLEMHSQHLLKDGKELATPEENQTELLAQAKTFAEKQLPIMKALMVV
ncbi:class I SAM-dependent methyltransferase [Acidovorax sp.]|uniref:class I SAM-dependent methyltransferase n=1 Tax=Acidovorax sp. TaxID=1872122 RepID=UPI003D06EF8A